MHASYCPECRGPLAFGEEGTARCTLHGGEYKVLFRRALLVDPPPAGSDSPAPAELFCVQHPTVPATHHCYSCFDGVCATCDFVFPGDRHFCPRCATDPQPELSARRKKLRAWSMGLAGFTTFWWVLFFGGISTGLIADKETIEALGILFGLVALIAPVVGVAQALSATDRKLANPLSLRLAALWNGMLIAVFVLRVLTVNLRSGK
jgi:hypothetical protein